jgi:hypothetical protein
LECIAGTVDFFQNRPGLGLDDWGIGCGGHESEACRLGILGFRAEPIGGQEYMHASCCEVFPA